MKPGRKPIQDEFSHLRSPRQRSHLRALRDRGEEYRQKWMKGIEECHKRKRLRDRLASGLPAAATLSCRACRRTVEKSLAVIEGRYVGRVGTGNVPWICNEC